MTLLSLDSVSKHFGTVVAVDQLGFTVGRGEVVGFLGPNGAGKSTTMRMITQYLEPDHGEIRLDGVPLDDAGRDAKRRIGYLPENNPLYPDMLVSEYLDFIVRLREIPAAERPGAIDRAVGRTGIETVFYRSIGELSKGFRQRVGLAQAIVHEPDLLVLDEPTEGLDPNQRVEIRHLISEVGRDRTVMLSTHVLPEVQHMCSRLLIISRGRLVADGPVGQLVARAEGLQQISVEIAGAGVADGLRALAGVTSVEELGSNDGRTSAMVTAAGDADLRPAIYRLAVERDWVLYELYQAGGSLEELFRQLTTEGGRA
ncbi:MAG: ABC transporter ATP-binding protein [Gemmatimonadota bacterium]|nr:ABC transporter ATP-binding protein [Gemmatimonadota bacterium]MDH5195766.1 ABC transporter ATP-binding protein [Gemmatimonadota bacterium]